MATYKLRKVITADNYYAGNGRFRVTAYLECGHVTDLWERSDRKYPSDWYGERVRCYDCAKKENSNGNI